MMTQRKSLTKEETEHLFLEIQEIARKAFLRSLSAKGADVAMMIWKGKKNKEISEELKISKDAAESRVKMVLRKMGIKGRSSRLHLTVLQEILLTFFYRRVSHDNINPNRPVFNASSTSATDESAG